MSAQLLAGVVQIAAAVEVYAQQEGIVNIYSDETPGREFIEQARAALTAESADQAAEIGRRLSVRQVLELAATGARLLKSPNDARA